jgi:hypothetical protein
MIDIYCLIMRHKYWNVLQISCGQIVCIISSYGDDRSARYIIKVYIYIYIYNIGTTGAAYYNNIPYYLYYNKTNRLQPIIHVRTTTIRIPWHWVGVAQIYTHTHIHVRVYIQRPVERLPKRSLQRIYRYVCVDNDRTRLANSLIIIIIIMFVVQSDFTTLPAV